MRLTAALLSAAASAAALPILMKIILFQPQIPQNTGNIVRTCAVTGCDLVLVRPGFSTSNRWLKRAGLDYWEGVNVSVVDDLESLLDQAQNHFFFFSSKASRRYTDVSYTSSDWLIFGSETEGLPQTVFESWPERFVTLPMLPEARCLNLATSVGIAIYEAWRQQDFPLPA
ncbi:MAG: tRNA (cytidine(34)-2'-O)-methyltransferase [Parachlamydia sp.]|nr:tRNA (cytidine(34)-2'-O)-methyltransferase [Parachlamydia sp.]